MMVAVQVMLVFSGAGLGTLGLSVTVTVGGLVAAAAAPANEPTARTIEIQTPNILDRGMLPVLIALIFLKVIFGRSEIVVLLRR
jgi:hypothetical protein